jgi:hypothetical protein
MPCPVTHPNGKAPDPGGAFSGGFNHGTTALGVELWPDGRLRAGRLPDGGVYAPIGEDGSVRAKQGWWRAVTGMLAISGMRLDGGAEPLSADVRDGYGGRGFQPAELTFPTPGCWRVVGTLDDYRLAYVVSVRG